MFTLMKNVFKPLVKSILITLGLKIAVSTADLGIHRKIQIKYDDYINNFKWRNPWYNENS